MERSGGPHSDSGSNSPTWDRDRRGPPPGPPPPGVYHASQKSRSLSCDRATLCSSTTAFRTFYTLVERMRKPFMYDWGVRKGWSDLIRLHFGSSPWILQNKVFLFLSLGYLFPEPGGPMFRRPPPPPGALGYLPPPGPLPPGPLHPRNLHSGLAGTSPLLITALLSSFFDGYVFFWCF